MCTTWVSSLQAPVCGFSLREIAVYDFEPRLCRQQAVMTQGVDNEMVEGRV